MAGRSKRLVGITQSLAGHEVWQASKDCRTANLAGRPAKLAGKQSLQAGHQFW
jgi:hypothetical protein